MRIAVAFLATLVLGVFPVAASAATGSWAEHYRDTVGDVSGAPDILNVSVGFSDDDIVSFAVYADLSAASSGVSVFLNTDGSASTGAAKLIGADYAFIATDGGKSVGLVRWRNGGWQDVASKTARSNAYSGTVLFVIDRKELGNPTALDVVAVSVLGSSGDRAPNVGSIHYNLAPLKLSTKAFSAKSGQLRETVSFVPMRSDSGGPLTGVLPYCNVHVGSKVVFAKTVASAKNGRPATCMWTFPTTLRGKKATASMRVVYAGRTASRTASFTIH